MSQATNALILVHQEFTVATVTMIPLSGLYLQCPWGLDVFLQTQADSLFSKPPDWILGEMPLLALQEPAAE